VYVLSKVNCRVGIVEYVRICTCMRSLYAHSDLARRLVFSLQGPGPVFSIQYPVSSVQCPASSVGRQASSRSLASCLQGPVQNLASSLQLQGP